MSYHGFKHSPFKWLTCSQHWLPKRTRCDFHFPQNDNSKRRRFNSSLILRRRGISLFTAAMSTNHDSHKFDWHFDTELEDETIELRGKKLFFVIVLFAIVLFTTALFFYTRWICRSRGLIPTTTSFASSIHLRHAPPHQQSEGLDAAAIKKLPIVLHHEPPSSPADPNGGGGGAALADCCICLCAFKDGEKLKVLPVCEHWFHCECVDKWLRNHSSCPLCRASLKLDPNSFPKILIQEPPLRINDRF